MELVGSIVTRMQNDCLLDGEWEADGKKFDEFCHTVGGAHVRGLVGMCRDRLVAAEVAPTELDLIELAFQLFAHQ